METSVFKREHLSDVQQINPSLYNLTIGLILCWGLFVNWLMMVTIPVESLAMPSIIGCFIGYFLCCMAGSFILNRSENPLISFFGYNLIVVPFGLVLNFVVSQFDSALVLEAMRVTGEITFVMMLLGSMYPAFFQGIGRRCFRLADHSGRATGGSVHLPQISPADRLGGGADFQWLHRLRLGARQCAPKRWITLSTAPPRCVSILSTCSCVSYASSAVANLPAFHHRLLYHRSLWLPFCGASLFFGV